MGLRIFFIDWWKRIFNSPYYGSEPGVILCPRCGKRMPDDTCYDGFAYCPRCGKEFDIHE